MLLISDSVHANESVNIATEQAIIGSILVDFASQRCQSIIEQLNSSDFYLPAHQKYLMR